MRKTVKVSNITCAQCAKTIESHFKALDIDVKVLVPSKKVIIENDQPLEDEFIHNELLKIGYYPLIDNLDQKKAKLKDRIDLLIAFVFSLPLLYTMFYHFGINVPMPNILLSGYFQWIITTPVLFISGRRFFVSTFHQLKYKNTTMDTLVVIGTLSAYIYSIYLTLTSNAHHLYFETTAVIIFMVLLGNAFENRVKEKTSDALQQLVSLSSKTAKVKVDNTFVVKPIEDVKVGDTIIVLSNEKVPLDGIVSKGMTYVDESMITGEPMPVLKNEKNSVIGSTLNILDTIEVLVTKGYQDTVLAKIIETVENTSLIKPKAQRVADKIAQFFVPSVIIISIITLLTYLLISKPIDEAFSAAIAVLVISCPCALGLATPTSVSVASGIAFKKGIMYKGGEFFEVAHKINAILFDKTGTLTHGKPEMIDFLGDKETLKYTASLEYHSNHPIAKSITSQYQGELLEVKNFETLLGLGIKGNIDGKLVYVGSKKLVNELNVDPTFDETPYIKEGKTIFYTVYDGKVVNLITVSDTLKEDAKTLIDILKERKIQPIMVTGDNKTTAEYIAGLVGIHTVYADVLPHEKALIVNKVQKEGNVVAFIGDGINDAPALKMADVGISVHSGHDIALDSSDVTLMQPNLDLVIDAIDLSKATLKNIYLNFLWAFLYNVCMIPLAALGFLNPTLAGIGMGFSSIAVVINALSLNLFKSKIKKEVKS